MYMDSFWLFLLLGGGICLWIQYAIIKSAVKDAILSAVKELKENQEEKPPVPTVNTIEKDS